LSPLPAIVLRTPPILWTPTHLSVEEL